MTITNVAFMNVRAFKINTIPGKMSDEILAIFTMCHSLSTAEDFMMIRSI